MFIFEKSIKMDYPIYFYRNIDISCSGILLWFKKPSIYIDFDRNEVKNASNILFLCKASVDQIRKKALQSKVFI